MLDVGGLSLGLLKVMPLFKVVNAIGSSYFPERTINILVLNAPRVFQQLWAIVRASAPQAAAVQRALTRTPRPIAQLQKLVDPRTQKKVHILSGGEHQLTGAQARVKPSRSAVLTGDWLCGCCAPRAVLRTFLEDADIPVSLGGKRPAPFLSGSDAQATAAVYVRRARGCLMREG